MKNAYIFEVRYLPATDTRGTRLKVSFNHGGHFEHVQTFPFLYGNNSNFEHAYGLAQEYMYTKYGVEVSQEHAFRDATKRGYLIGFILP